jgi:hypothetical protein
MKITFINIDDWYDSRAVYVDGELKGFLTAKKDNQFEEQLCRLLFPAIKIENLSASESWLNAVSVDVENLIFAMPRYLDAIPLEEKEEEESKHIIKSSEELTYDPLEDPFSKAI